MFGGSRALNEVNKLKLFPTLDDAPVELGVELLDKLALLVKTCKGIKEL